MLSRFVKRRCIRQRVAVLRDRMLRTAYAWCHNNALAEDLVHEAILKAIENASHLRDVKAADAWIFTILVNCHRMYLRRANDGADPEQIESCVVESEHLPDRIADAQDLVARVRHALADLNEQQRKVITLVDLEGFSYTEVADILGVPTGTVMSRLSRARQNLKKVLSSRAERHNSPIAYLRPRS